MEELDGILLTGGANLFDLKEFTIKGKEYFRIDKNSNNTYYLNLVSKILEKAKEINDEGRTFIVYGICLGFQGIILSESHLDIKISNVKRLNMQD